MNFFRTQKSQPSMNDVLESKKVLDALTKDYNDQIYKTFSSNYSQRHDDRQNQSLNDQLFLEIQEKIKLNHESPQLINEKICSDIKGDENSFVKSITDILLENSNINPLLDSETGKKMTEIAKSYKFKFTHENHEITNEINRLKRKFFDYQNVSDDISFDVIDNDFTKIVKKTKKPFIPHRTFSIDDLLIEERDGDDIRISDSDSDFENYLNNCPKSFKRMNRTALSIDSFNSYSDKKEKMKKRYPITNMPENSETEKNRNNRIENTQNIEDFLIIEEEDINELLINSNSILKEQAMKEQAIKEQTIKEQTIKEQAIKEQALKEQAIKEQVLREQAIKEQAMKEQALREQALKEQAMKEQAIKEQALREQAIKEQAMKEQALREQALKEQAMKEQAIKEQALREQAIKEQAMKEQAIKEQALREQAIKEQAMKEQALREQALKEQAMKEQAIKEQALREQAMKEQEMKEQALREQALKEHEMKEQALKEQAMKEQALREQAIKEQVLREQALREQALKEQALREQAIKEQEMKEQAIKEQALREQAIKEQEMKERALKEQEMKEQALKEQTIKEQVIKEQAIMSNISATLPCITLDVDDMNEEYNSNDNFMNIFKDYSYDCTIEELNESFDVERINSDCFHHDKRSTQTNNVDQGITLESDVKESKVKESEVKMNALVSQDEQVKHHHHNHSLSNFMENTDTLGKTKEWKNAQKDFDDFSTIFQEKEHQQSYNENSRNEIIPLKKASSKVKVDKKPNNAPDKVESILFSEEPTSKKTTNRPKTSVPNSASMPSVSKDDKKSAKRASKKKPSNELFGYGFFSLFK